MGLRVQGALAVAPGHLRPYASVHLQRSAHGEDRARFINERASTPTVTSGGGTSAQAVLGFELGIGARAGVHAEIGKRMALDGDTRVASRHQAQAGLRLRW